MTEQELLGLEPHRIDPSLGNKKYTFVVDLALVRPQLL